MPGELFISVHDVSSGADVIQKEKNPTLFPVSPHTCCSNAVPSRARRAQGQQGTTASSSLCRLQPALPFPVCWVWISSVLGSSCQPLSVQSSHRPGLEQQLESSKTGAGTCTWVCFSVSPWGCVWQVLPAGPPAPRESGDGISSS